MAGVQDAVARRVRIDQMRPAPQSMSRKKLFALARDSLMMPD